MDWAAIVWMVLMVGFLIVEAACPFHLVSIWFAAGALIAGIGAMLNWSLGIQILCFMVVSGGLLLAFFPLVKKVLNPSVVQTNVDALVGSKCYVTAPIDNITATGQVKLNGMAWTARSASGEPIEVGKLVKVERIEGVKVFVSPVETNVKAVEKEEITVNP